MLGVALLEQQPIYAVKFQAVLRVRVVARRDTSRSEFVEGMVELVDQGRGEPDALSQHVG